MKSSCLIGGILRHTDGIGFKLTFIGDDNEEQAQHYKDMFKYIIESDKIKVRILKGYMDRRE